MNYLTSLDLQIEERIVSLFKTAIDVSALKIELSIEDSPLYHNYLAFFGVPAVEIIQQLGHEQFPIIDLLGTYNPKNEKVTIFLSNILGLKWSLQPYFDERIDEKFLMKLVYFHLIGRWICHVIEIRGKKSNVKEFQNCGENYIIFISQMITYHCFDEKDKKLFLKFSKHLSEEYYLFTHFVRDFQSINTNTCEISIDDLFDFIEMARREEGKVSQHFISNYFDEIIHTRICEDPSIIKCIFPILTEEQKEFFKHLNEDYGFFPA